MEHLVYLNNNHEFTSKIAAFFNKGYKALSSLFLIFTFFLSGTASAQIDLTSCYGSCTSNDFTIVRAYLVDASTKLELTDAACNNPDATVLAYMAFDFRNNTNSDRSGIFISGTVSGAQSVGGSTNGYIYKCFPGILPKKSTTTYIDESHLVTWKCGTTLTLTGTFISWGSAGEQVCSITCKEATPSKCRMVGDVIIQTPLSANFTFDADCEANQLFQTVDFSGTAAGGNPPYTFSWDFGDGTTATGQNVSHTYSAAGDFTVTLTVKDQNGAGATKTASKTVPVTSCCTAPTIDQGPSNDEVCEGASASFTVTYSGGTPAPTIQWQVSTDGTNFSNLTEGSPYSGVNTATLTINPTAIGLNGNWYQAVLTSGECEAVLSGKAQLTVNAYPALPAVEITEPSVCGSATGTLKITNALSGASYTFTQDAGGNTQTLVSSGSELTFTTGLVAGKKFYVTGDNQGCVSDEANCTTMSSLAKQDAAGSTSKPDAVETINAQIISKAIPKVTAAPNPFSTRLRFQLKSDVSGRGSLELYNMMGQRVQVVFQGNIEAGKSQTIEYSVPSTQRTNLIYVFRVGEQSTSGKLIGMKE